LNPDDRSGLRLAARDLDGDGKAELVVGSGAKAAAQVRVLTLADMQNPAGPATPIQDPFDGIPTLDGVYVG
ncbi:MAG TPA: hypothetical protein VKE74_23430, partial [Gemmataceae bacterium]|nr:hypothetical protein [Gemmataceae bacterium]